MFVAFRNPQVIDKKKGVQECRECDGRGVKVEVVRMGLLRLQEDLVEIRKFQVPYWWAPDPVINGMTMGSPYKWPKIY